MLRPIAIVLLLVLLVAAGVALINIWHLDRFDGWLLARFYQDDTEYASGYSDSAYRKIHEGNREAEVMELLGEPLKESWVFERSDGKRLQIFFSRDGRAETVAPPDETRFIGMSPEAVRMVTGQPDLRILVYSHSPNDLSYRYRVIHLRHGRVTEKLHGYYLD